MKRTLVLLAVLFASWVASAQGESASEGNLLIIPRLDFEPSHTAEDGWVYDFSSSALYTLFEGTIGNHLSYSVSNHWLSTTPKDLYMIKFDGEQADWVDWANVTLKLGNFSFTGGKDYARIGAFEEDAYDYDSHYQVNSYLWNNFQSYRWGGSVGWMSDDESVGVLLQRLTGVTTANLSFNSDAVSLMGSVSRFDDSYTVSEECPIRWLGALGAEFYVSDAVTVGSDIHLSENYHSLMASCTASVTDKLDLYGKAACEGIEKSQNYFFGGAGINWYPLNSGRDLRVHALALYETSMNTLYFALGVTYFLNLKIY